MNPTRRIQSTIEQGSFDVNRLSAWYEDLEDYEKNLEEIGNTTLDQTFQDEMQHVNQWFSYLTDAEKTATIYTLLQHSSQVQIKFFIHLLQEMRKPKLNLLNRNSERASNLMNLNIRQPTSHSPTNSQTINPQNNRHSFALGDTQELSKMFGHMSTDWFGPDDQSTSHTKQPAINIPKQSNTSLRPKSFVEADQSFSNSWLKPSYNKNVIQRPRSADISSWTIPKNESWQPLNNQHDIDFQQWKGSAGLSNTLVSGTSYDEKKSFGQFLTTHPVFENDKHLGYTSDPSEMSNNARYRSNNNNNKTIKEKDNQVDMELVKDVSAWFRSMRLHKYNPIFATMRWQDIIILTDEDLEKKGVAALGARRKMLKAFDAVKEHCQENNIEY